VDIAYITFMGNYSEFLYNRDKRPEVGEIVKEVRTLLLKRMRQLGLEINNQDVNADCKALLNKNRPKLTEEGLQ